MEGSRELLIGIDGCRAGWVVAEADTALRAISVRIEPTLDALFARAASGEVLVVIDIPIGLATNQRRAADGLARARLRSPRASSVFSAPSRAALAAKSYLEACDLNEGACQRRLSQQSYAILSKIREVDVLMSPSLQANVREGHPEVIFADLAGLPRGLSEPKKTSAGRDERVRILRQHLTPPDIVATRTELGGARNVGLDDIIDALACLVTASRILAGTARVYPAEPEYDAVGLQMEIVA